MIHIVDINEYSNGNKVFTLFETNTESFFKMNREELRNLIIVRRLNLGNMGLLEDVTKSRHWINAVHYENEDNHTGSDFTLICKIGEDSYKLVSYNEKILYMAKEQLLWCIQGPKITNCDIVKGKLKTLGAYKITKDTMFENEIAQKYNQYEAKSTMLGRKMSFEYNIEGKKVRLTKYTGVTKDVIIPKFVTTIMEKAFYDCEIETLTLDKGLRYIGRLAFGRNKINEVKIPQTVEFMGEGVFYRNKQLLDTNGQYLEDKVKLLSKRTTVIDKTELNDKWRD